MSAPIVLRSPGPIADAFMRSRAFVVIIIGPVGSGKTMAALQKGQRNGALQGARLDDQGVRRRRARFGVIRESYPSLDANTLPSWFNIVPRDYGHFSGKAPYTHKFQQVLRRTTDGRPSDVLDMEVEFRAIGEQGVEAATRGWEVNSVMVDEGDLQPAELVSYLSGRVGRFSGLSPELVVDPQIIISSNAPYLDNWLYDMAIDKKFEQLLDTSDPDLAAALDGRPLIETFIQPGGMADGAENLHNLRGGRSYYVLQRALNKHRPSYIDRMVDNKFVPMQHGQPVYGGFDYAAHVAADGIDWDPRRKLIVGIDQGVFASAVFAQRTAMGELRVLDEVVIIAKADEALVKIGPKAFGKMVRTKLYERFADIRDDQVVFIADPAAFQAKDNHASELDWVRMCSAELGFKIRKAKTNVESLRLAAVRKAQSERGGYRIDYRCRHLIKAHLGGYRYRKAQLGDTETRGHLEIADTIYTHVADAEQYAALEGEHVIGDLRGKARTRPAIVIDGNYNELGG